MFKFCRFSPKIKAEKGQYYHMLCVKSLEIACIRIVFTDFFHYFSERARRKVAGCQGRTEVLAEASTGPGKSSTSY